MTDDTIEQIAKAIYEVDVSQDAHPECTPNWEDIHAYHDEYNRKARAALSAMPQQEVTVKDADIEKAVLVLLGKSKEHAPGVDYVASRTMKKSEWCERMKAALRAISEGE